MLEKKANQIINKLNDVLLTNFNIVKSNKKEVLIASDNYKFPFSDNNRILLRLLNNGKAIFYITLKHQNNKKTDEISNFMSSYTDYKIDYIELENYNAFFMEHKINKNLSNSEITSMIIGRIIELTLDENIINRLYLLNCMEAN